MSVGRGMPARLVMFLGIIMDVKSFGEEKLNRKVQVLFVYPFSPTSVLAFLLPFVCSVCVRVCVCVCVCVQIFVLVDCCTGLVFSVCVSQSRGITQQGMATKIQELEKKLTLTNQETARRLNMEVPLPDKASPASGVRVRGCACVCVCVCVCSDCQKSQALFG